jgi:hypothetical protein
VVGAGKVPPVGLDTLYRTAKSAYASAVQQRKKRPLACYGAIESALRKRSKEAVHKFFLPSQVPLRKGPPRKEAKGVAEALVRVVTWGLKWTA